MSSALAGVHVQLGDTTPAAAVDAAIGETSDCERSSRPLGMP